MPGASRSRQPDVFEDVAWACAVALCARHFKVSPAQVMDLRGRATRATGAVLEARRGALYLTATALNQAGRALCRATGMDHKTITHHLRRVEDDRELQAELDALLDVLTDQLQAGLTALIAELRPASPLRRVA